jgi:hypothetical protein
MNAYSTLACINVAICALAAFVCAITGTGWGLLALLFLHGLTDDGEGQDND